MADETLAARRKKDEHGLTTRERQVLTLRETTEMNWSQIARTLGVSRNRVKEIKQSLEKKGVLSDESK